MCLVFFFVFGRIDPDAAFSLCVSFGDYCAKLDDGTCELVSRKYDEWVVDYRCCSLESLQKDFASRVKWGSNQEVVVSGFDKSTGMETKIEDNMALLRAFSERCGEKRLFFIVDVVDKPGQLVSTSTVTALNEVVISNVVTEKVIAREGSSNEVGNLSNVQVPTVVDWDSLEIVPIPEEQIGCALAVMGEVEMYSYLGLRDEDDRAEQARLAAEKEKESVVVDGDFEGAELPVNDFVPGEGAFLYDREDPLMTVGSTYSSMNEFRSAVRQHAIKGQFELGTEKSDSDRFRGYCTAEGCPWAIVARQLRGVGEGKSVRVLTFNFAYWCNLSNFS